MRTSETARTDRFAAYVGRLAAALGHRDRHEPLRAYVTGLCLPGDRKSIEPMAARVDPRHVQARHQSMHHFVADAPWDAGAVLRVAREWVLEPMARHGPVAAWIVDDTAFPKKGQHSVGVARQYCGVLGKQENCQVAVSVSVANDAVSLPVAYQLYLPESWARDRRRRRAVGVPDAVPFQPKWQIALGQIRTLQAEGLPPAPVVADAGYGDTTEFREALTTARIPYVVGVKGETTVWRPGEAPLPPKRGSGRGRPPTRGRRTARHAPLSLKRLAVEVPAAAWRTVTWREGMRGAMRSRFARLRVRPAHRDEQRATPRPDEWLLIEWPRGAPEPTKYWLSTLPETVAVADLVRLAKLRWRADRARLSGAQGRARAGPLRGPRLAWVPSSWRVMYRGLRLPRRRAREAFPPGASGLPPARSPSQRLQAAGHSRCGLNGMCPRRSPRPTPSSPAPCSPTRPVAGAGTSRGPADVF